MATTGLGYLDRRLWDDAGTVEAGPWVSTTRTRGTTVRRARLGAHVGVLYWNPGPGIVASNRYDVEAFGRVTGEASVRSPSWGGRLFAGAYLGSSSLVGRQGSSLSAVEQCATFTDP